MYQSIKQAINYNQAYNYLVVLPINQFLIWLVNE